jgi:hypothetical protein
VSGAWRLDWTLVGLGALAAAAAATGLYAVTSSFLQKWKRKSPEEIERLRRMDVNRCGRITSAQIIDWVERTPPEDALRLVVYKYEVGGVVYEAAQEVSALPDFKLPETDAECLTAHVKFDPKKPTNSIIVCEEWSGLHRPLTRPAAETNG